MAKKAAETKPDALKGQEPVVVLKGPERLLQRLAIQNMGREGFFSSTDRMAWPSNDIEATKCNWRMSWMRLRTPSWRPTPWSSLRG